MQSMTFSQQLIITLIDKLVIALVLALVGLWVNKKLGEFKGREDERIEAIKGQQAAWLEILKGHQALSLELHKDQQALAKELRDLQAQKELQATAQIASARLPAYERLWEVQWIVSPTLSFDLTAQERKDLETKLITCFYQDGNGLFLSHSALSSFQAALNCLAREH